MEGIALIAGLGNPGKEYEGTRHNAGFMVVDLLLTMLPGTFEKHNGFSSLYWSGRFGGRNVYIQKPMTYMNLSGKAIKSLMDSKKISPQQIMLVYDDMDLPLGTIRMRKDGSSGGHNGIKSVMEETGASDFPRLRIGIGHGNIKEQRDHVLSGFHDEEKEIFSEVTKVSAEAIKLALCRGLDEAMNIYNRKGLVKKASEIKKENPIIK